jgi:hypothetical protein
MEFKRSASCSGSFNPARDRRYPLNRRLSCLLSQFRWFGYTVFFIFHWSLYSGLCFTARHSTRLIQAHRVSKYTFCDNRWKHYSMCCGFHFKDIALLTTYKWQDCCAEWTNYLQSELEVILHLYQIHQKHLSEWSHPLQKPTLDVPVMEWE